MRIWSLGLVSIATLTAGCAFAADLGYPARAPAVVAPVEYVNWNGFYIGAMGGYGWGRGFDRTFGNRINVDGGFAGGTIGFNFQGLNSPFVFGIEADGAWADISGTNAAFGATSRLEAFGTVRGRVGYAFSNVLAYGTGGFAIGSNRVTVAGLGNSTQTHTGWTAGGGLEWAFSPNWSAKIEYLYMDFGREAYFGGPAAGGINADIYVHTVKAGINYRFNWGAPAAPIVARY